MVQKAIEKVWYQFDENGNGVLDLKEARNFVKQVIKTLVGDKKQKID